MNTNLISAATLLLTGAIALNPAGAQLALADTSCTPTAIVTPTGYQYALCDVPDLDQQRIASGSLAGLPGGGAMYCAPTAAMDFITYFANHGKSQMDPGPGSWGPGDATEYETITQSLRQLGQLMKTDPVNGTGGDDGAAGLQAWLDENSPGDFVVSQYYMDGATRVDLDSMADLALDGSYVNAIVGWYSNSGAIDPSNPQKHLRAGGHLLTLVQAQKVTGGGGSTRVIGLRDPATGGSSASSQSAFATDTYVVTPVPATYGSVDSDGVESTFQQTADRVVGLGSAFVDGCYAIRTKDSLVVDGSNFIITKPFTFRDLPYPNPRVFSTPTGDPVVDVAFGPTTRHPFLVANSSKIWQLDSVTGASTAIATVAGARRLAYGAGQVFYALTGNAIVALDSTGRIRASVALGGSSSIDTIAFDRTRNRLVGFSSATNRLLYFDPSLVARGSVALPPDPCHGTWTMSINPSTGTTYLHCDGITTVTRITFDRAGNPTAARITLAGTRAPKGLSVDARDRVFVNDGAYVAEFEANGARVERSSFAAMHGGQIVQILRPFSNFDPSRQNGPAFRNVLPQNAIR